MKAHGDLEGERFADGFDQAVRGTVGAEEELMLLDAATYELVPEVPGVVAKLNGDERFAEELPASQVEIRTVPCASIAELGAQLRQGRRDLNAAVAESFELAGAGVHPLAHPRGEINPAARYVENRRQLGDAVLSRQLVFAFQVHVAPGDADTTLAVYNALRSYMPELAALAANAPFYEGEDTGLASIRPQISLLLPRQGVAPVISSWKAFERDLAWGKAGGVIPDDGSWWWELRPRPALGTLEVRVPDTQTTVAEAEALAALVHCLVIWLSDCHLAGETLPIDPSWRIAENRWLAARDGIEAELFNLETGERGALRGRIEALLELLSGKASELDCTEELGGVEALLRKNGAVRQREVAEERGVEAVPEWLASRFLEDV